MAKAPTHYQVTIKQPVTFAGVSFKPGRRYTLKAKLHDDIKAEHPDAFEQSVAMKAE